MAWDDGRKKSPRSLCNKSADVLYSSTLPVSSGCHDDSQFVRNPSQVPRTLAIYGLRGKVGPCMGSNIIPLLVPTQPPTAAVVSFHNKSQSLASAPGAARLIMLKFPPLPLSLHQTTLQVRSTLHLLLRIHSSALPHFSDPSRWREKHIPLSKTWVWFASPSVDVALVFAPLFPSLSLSFPLALRAEAPGSFPAVPGPRRSPQVLVFFKDQGQLEETRRQVRPGLCWPAQGELGSVPHRPILPEIMSSVLFLASRSQCDIGNILISGHLQPPNLARRFILLAYLTNCFVTLVTSGTVRLLCMSPVSEKQICSREVPASVLA